jgi:uncharacterized repeat protein (TIGR01451 family)
MTLASGCGVPHSPTPMRSTPSGNRRFASVRPGILLVVLALAGAPAAGQDEAPSGESGNPVATGTGPLETTIVAETLQVEESANGSMVRRWRSATRLSAGDEVYYTIRVRNPGKIPVSDVVVTKRLPFGMHYKRGSAVGPACEVQFSVDGGTTFDPAARLGGGVEPKQSRTMQATEYTHLRWILRRPLAPGATALLRFRATFT